MMSVSASSLGCATHHNRTFGVGFRPFSGRLRIPAGRLRVQLPDRPYLDAALARGRNLAGQLGCVVQVPRVDQVEACQLLLRLGEGAVGDRQLPVPDADRGGRLNRLERLRREEQAALPEPVPAGLAFAVRPGAQFFIFEVNQAQVLHMSPVSLMSASWRSINPR